MTGRVYPPLADRLAMQLDKSTGCWLWTGYVLKSGYAQIKRDGRSAYVHRVAFELHHGIDLASPKDGGPLVCHHCDVRHCANPEHLFLGTPTDNVQDMIRKGRRVASDQRGAANNSAKLTEEQVHEIRRDTRRLQDIAEDYGVALSTISLVKSHDRWSHLV